MTDADGDMSSYDAARTDTALALYRLARECSDGLRNSDAIECLRASVLLEPHFKALECLGELLMQSQQHREATIYLAAAAGLAPAQSRARFLLAEALLACGDTRTASVQLTETLRVNPQYKTARELLDRLPDEGRGESASDC